jgi:hypothetical protein
MKPLNLDSRLFLIFMAVLGLCWFFPVLTLWFMIIDFIFSLFLIYKMKKIISQLKNTESSIDLSNIMPEAIKIASQMVQSYDLESKKKKSK